MTSFINIKKRSRELYDQWRKVGSYSPALKSKIRVSLLGWKHITGTTGYKKRPLSDVIRRLKLISDAKEIIETSTTLQGKSIRNNKTYYSLDALNSEGIGIRVIQL